MNKGMRAWPESERPRERVLQKGIEALSDSELVALLLGNGTRGKDVVTFAREILAECGGLRGLATLNAEELQRIKGLGPAKVSALLAATEMARRRFREELMGRDVMRDPNSVIEYLYASLRDRKKEVFKVIFLDKANRVVDERNLFEGTVDQTAVHPREVVQAALRYHATALILVHNHPSGRTQPSPEDREITRRIGEACQALSIKVLDHLIIGDNQYFSFSEHGLL